MRRKIAMLFVLGLLMEVCPAVSADWTSLPSLPEARFGVAATSLGSDVRVLGGFGATGISTGHGVWNDAVGSWSEGPAMSQGRFLGAAVSSGGALFAVGGFDEFGVLSAAVERFDPATGSWSARAPMPFPRAAMGVAAIGADLFVAGGEGDFGLVSETFRYLGAEDRWVDQPSMPSPRTGVAATAFQSAFWVLGGSFDGSPVATVERLVPGVGWQTMPSLPEPLWLASAAVAQDRMWIVGGVDGSLTRSARVYSAGADGAWRAEASLPEALSAASLAGRGECLVVAGGQNASGLPSAAVYALCADAPPPPPPADTLRVTVALSPNHVNASSNGRWIKADVRAVGSWSVSDIDVASVRLGGVPVDPEAAPEFGDDELRLKFVRQSLAALGNGTHQLAFVAHTWDGTAVAGEATFTVDGAGAKAKRKAMGAPRLAANGVATLQFTLETDQDIALDVLDVQGRVVERLARGRFGAGEYRREWPSGRSVSNGFYFVRLRHAGGDETVRLSVLR